MQNPLLLGFFTLSTSGFNGMISVVQVDVMRTKVEGRRRKVEFEKRP